MILGQETGVLVAEPFNRLIALDTPFIASMFVARRRTGLLSYHLQQIMFLEKWKTSDFDLTVLFLWHKFHLKKA